MGVTTTVRLIAFLASLSILVLQGCKTAGSEALTGKDPAEQRVSEKRLPLKVAVLPFENLTDKAEAVEIVRRAFYNHFSSRKYQDIELFRVDENLQSRTLLEQNKFLEAPTSTIGETVGADGLIYGKITAMDRIFIGIYSQVAIELEARLVLADTGETVWERKHRATHHEGGVSIDPLGLIPAVIRSALNMRAVELLRTSDDLAREMLADMPEPAIGEVMKRPRIELVTHDSAGVWKKAGDLIRVAMVGDPGMLASFDIGDAKRGVPLTEEKKGVYEGYYRVMPGDSIKEALIVGHLADERGNRGDWVDPLGAVNIDTIPPESPTAPEALGRDGSVFVKWADLKDPDLLEYRVYRSVSLRNGYKELTRTQVNHFHDTEVKNGVPVYYKVSALDKAGNESVPSEPSWTVPSKPGPTSVYGLIQADTVWHAAASPYIIKKKVEVMNGTTLTIEAGTVVRSEGDGIVVRGRLLAKGRKDSLIQFLGLGEDGGEPVWEGILFDNTRDSESRVVQCKIKQARTSIDLISSSPAISQNLITENGRGIRVREFSNPVITDNQVVNNLEEGLTCERSDPVITGNTVRQNQKGGILCRHGSPVVRHNNIFDNMGYNLQATGSAESMLVVPDNWWGSTDPARVGAGIKGFAGCLTVLAGPYPEGKPVELALKRTEAPVVEKQTPRPPPQLRKTDQKEVAKLLSVAQDQQGKGKHEEARETLLKAVAAQQENHGAWFLLGMSYFQLGNSAEAIKSMEKAVDLDPNNSGYRYNLGLAYSEMGDPARAVEQWQTVLSLDPMNQNARMILEMEGNR